MQIILTEHALQLQSELNVSFIPQLATDGSAGYDLRACIAQPIHLPAGSFLKIPLGFHLHIQDKTQVGLIFARSGKSMHNFGLKNFVGVVDSDYQDEWAAIIWNHGVLQNKHITIQPGEKIAQLVFTTAHHPTFEIVDTFGETTERLGGFGSTDNVQDESTETVLQNADTEEQKEVKVADVKPSAKSSTKK